MRGDTEERQRLQHAMEQRAEWLGVTWRQVAEEAGLSYETVRSARKWRKQLPPPTRRGLERGLRWPTGYIDDFLAGKRLPANPPEAATDTGAERAAAAAPALRDDVERQLWAISELSEAERWDHILTHRHRQATDQPPQPQPQQDPTLPFNGSH